MWWSSGLTSSVIDGSRYRLGLVIRSFGSKETERLWRRERVRSIDPRIHRVALRKLRQVGSAESLEDLRVPPGNRLDALKGDRAGQHQDQRPVADLLRVDRRRTRGGGER